MNMPSLSITLARTPIARMRGLLGKTGLPPGHGLLILPCNAIHTIGMKFAIDVRFFDKKGNLVREYHHIQPGKWFVFGGFKAHSVLETQAGDAAFEGIQSRPHNLS
jgi:uncharacterized membrane protein (UPF0127 family)